jgi:hypothetical protein
MARRGARDARMFSEDFHFHALFHELRTLLGYVSLEQAHQCGNFRPRALPVFLGKCVQSEDADAGVNAAFRYFPD